MSRDFLTEEKPQKENQENLSVNIYMSVTLSLEDYNQLNFEEIRNKADGNCFFESLSYLDVQDAKFHNMYRDRICNFLKGYKMATTIDLEQEGGWLIKDDLDLEVEQLFNDGNYKSLQVNKKGLKKLLAYHVKSASEVYIEQGCKNKVWAGDIHIIASCLLFNVNITLYTLANNSYTLDMFEVDPSRPTYNFKFYDSVHYEALIPAPVYTPPPPGDGTRDLIEFDKPPLTASNNTIRTTRKNKNSKNKSKKVDIKKEIKEPVKLLNSKQLKQEKQEKQETENFKKNFDSWGWG